MLRWRYSPSYEILGRGESSLPRLSARPLPRYVSPMFRSRSTLLSIVLAAAACAGGRSPAPDVPDLRVERTPSSGGTRLLVIAPPDVKLSAAVKPRLELRDGRVLRFDTTAVSHDSLYYTAPPAAWMEGEDGEIRGTLHAGICDEVTSTCRRVQVEI